MGDGTVLRADIYYPTIAGTTTPADGPFPVLLEQTPYGKQFAVYAAGLARNGVGYLVDRGFMVVVADVRGTGDSGGTFDLFDPVQGRDGAELADWAATLPHADGSVGLIGSSYMGIDQYATVAAAGPHSPIKAMFPMVAGNDLYADSVTQGGIPDGEFGATYLAMLSGLDLSSPSLQPLATALRSGNSGQLARALNAAAPSVATDSPQLVSFLRSMLDIERGTGDNAFDGAYWAARSPTHDLAAVVADHVPAFLVGGWSDPFEAGEPLDYVGLQNLSVGRSQGAAMTPAQAVTPRYQLLMGPWQHEATGSGINVSAVELEWFDTWLLGRPTPLGSTTTPLHLKIQNTDQWVDAAQWPLPAATPTAYYFAAGHTGSDLVSSNDGQLTSAAPRFASGADTIHYAGAPSQCDVPTDQWGFASVALGFQSFENNDPCTLNDVALGKGPGSLTYTTVPLASPEVVAGPIDATVYMTSNTTETDLAATVEAVDPSGVSIPLTSGALLGSQRALDDRQTWTASNGAPLLPVHPLTESAARPVVADQVTRDDIALYPTVTELPAGWRLRVTITTAETPHLVPTATQYPKLIGGVYQVQRNTGAASLLNVPLSAPSDFTVPCGSLCSPGGP
jgi:putative CocE/NonD family hydrolase